MEFNKIGIIQNGQYANWNITILNDLQDTGGYYILIWITDDEGFDNWFEKVSDVEKYIKDNYIINWTDQIYKT